MNFVSTGKEQLGIGLKLEPDADQVLHQPEHEGAHGDQARPGQPPPVLALLLLQVGLLSSIVPYCPACAARTGPG